MLALNEMSRVSLWFRSLIQVQFELCVINPSFLPYSCLQGCVAPAGPTVMLARGVLTPFPVVTRLSSVKFVQRLSTNTLHGPCRRLRQALPPVQALHRHYHLAGRSPAGSLTGQTQTADGRTLPLFRSLTLQCR